MKDKFNKYVYIMVSATYTKVGKIIRYATKAEYNHVSISFDENMETLYSFGRIRHCMPLVGGLVHETIDRFTLRSPRNVHIRIYRIPVSAAAYECGLKRIQEIACDDEYAYNFVSALTYFIWQGVENYKTYVCSEFVSHMLRLMRPDLAFCKPDCKVIPDDFLLLLENYEVYSGNLSEYDKFIEVENELYFEKVGKIKRWRETYSFLKHRYWHYEPLDDGEEMDSEI